MTHAPAPRRSSVHHVVTHPSTPLIVLTAAAAVTLAGTFLPWLETGSKSRSSYDLLGVLRRLDIGQHGAVSTLVRWWPVVPLLITAAVVSAWWRWTWAAVVGSAVAAVYAGGVGLLLMNASPDTGVTLGPGPSMCTVGSAGLFAAAVWLGLTRATDRAVPAPRAAPPADRS